MAFDNSIPLPESKRSTFEPPTQIMNPVEENSDEISRQILLEMPFAFGIESPTGSSTTVQTHLDAQIIHRRPNYFHSRRVHKNEAMNQLLRKKTPREKWANAIPVIGFLIGLVLAAILVWTGIESVPTHDYCPVLIEDFSKGLNPAIWTKEVEVGGFGNGQFEETTNTDENVFVRNGKLFITPTIQNRIYLNTNHTINLLKDPDVCTAEKNKHANCVATTNTTTGIIVPPVKSGRINTKRGARIKYGRIEVVAKLSRGDWVWPAIWMLPVNTTYGAWPRSGEIDIAESRGNNYTYPLGGDDVVSGTLHWGPDAAADAWRRTTKQQAALRSTWGAGYHTYGLEWSEDYLFTYVDSRLLQVLYVRFDAPFWAKGDFPPADADGKVLVDPWSQTGRDATPFDQDFYLILSVGVGGTNGWFPDGVGGKPWVDASPTAKKEFWDARDMWLPTWTAGGAHMVVKSVKMWQQKGYNGCK